MRICEIITELSRPGSRQDAGRLLQRAGYRTIGGGLFATVWAKANDPFVLKLFTAQDTAYLQFLKLVQAMPNQHFPILRGKPMQISDRYYGVRIERLKPLPSSYAKFVDDCKWYMGAKANLRSAHTELQGKDRLRAVKERLEKINYLRVHYPSVAAALDAIDEYVIKPSPEIAMADINQWNMGLRGRTVVIFDPVGTASVAHDPEVNLAEGDDDDPTHEDLENIEHDKAVKRKPDMRKKRFVAMPGNQSFTDPAL